ncbi:probable oxidoreductase [Geofilum rubicundum JCM 15548]|uniref:Probable oxidoreductase n=2 Tax=Geofilum TaxID=1236988 RepID=A0A0E9LTV0_9BACT|nr:probable oxidoreductase [Geofilum rubicundum JCM 15548]
MGQAIKTALVSYGMSGKVFHAPLLKANGGFEVVKVMQRSTSTALEVFPDACIVQTFEELLNDAEIELVIVNTPDDLHYKQAKAALEAGKHVVVEKPFVQSVKQGEELIQLAKANNLTLTVFQNRRWDNSFLTVQKVLAENMLGRLVEFEARYNRYRTFVQESWKEERQRGTGILHNLGAHLIDQALLLFGMPQGVSARLLALRDGSDVDDHFDLRLIYAGLSVTLKAGYLVREDTPSYMLHGVKGSYVKYGLDPQEEALKKGMWPDGENWGTDPEELWGWLNSDVNNIHFKGKVETLPGNYGLFYSNLHEVIRKNAKVLVLPSEALNVVRIIEAAMQSNSDHCTVFLKS